MRKTIRDVDTSANVIGTKRRIVRRLRSPSHAHNVVEIISTSDAEELPSLSRGSCEDVDPLEIRPRNTHRESSNSGLQRTFGPMRTVSPTSPPRVVFHPYSQSGKRHSNGPPLEEYSSYSSSSRVDQDSIDILLEEFRNFQTAQSRAIRGLETRLNNRLQNVSEMFITELQSVRSDILDAIENWPSNEAGAPTSITDFKNGINLRISNMEDKILKSIKSKPTEGSFPEKPKFLPFKTYEDLADFDSSSKDDYDSLVQYLSNIGGWTAQSCMNSIFKESVFDEAVRNVSFTGYNKQMPFKELKFAKACQEALRSNPKFYLDAAVFADAASEALKASKQRERSKKARALNKNPKSVDSDDSTSSRSATDKNNS